MKENGISLIIVLLLLSANAEAQFLKKLKKKVENTVENVVTDKIANKTAQQTNKAMDKILNPKFKKNSPMPIGSEMGSLDDVPATYEFDWVYKLDIKTTRSKRKMDIAYYLKKDAPYWGAKMNQDMEMFMVYDLSRKLTVIFMQNDKNSFASVTKIPEEIIDDEVLDENVSFQDYTMKEIPGKEILGFQCKGYEMENDQYKFTLYNTFDTEVSFSDIYGKSEQLPKGFNVDWLKEGENEGLVMEMIMEDKKNKKNNMTMKCVELEKKSFTINKSDYNSLGGK